MSSELKIIYKTFIREKVNQEHIFYNENCKILGENFVGKYYLLLMEDWNKTKNIQDPDFHLLIENCKNPRCLQLKYIHKRDKYVRSQKATLEADDEIFKLLVKQGLFMNPDTAGNSYNSDILIHRLTLCLYENIIGLECHHGDKIKTNNGITNLTPIEKNKHKILDDEPTEIFTSRTKELHNAFVNRVFKSKRNTLSSRDKTVFQVLLEINSGLSVPKIAKKHSKLIGETSIQKIKNYYFYLEEFFQYLYKLCTTGFSPFNEDFEIQWFEPLKFDIIEDGNCQEQRELFDYLHPYLKRMFEKT